MHPEQDLAVPDKGRMAWNEDLAVLVSRPFRVYAVLAQVFSAENAAELKA